MKSYMGPDLAQHWDGYGDQSRQAVSFSVDDPDQYLLLQQLKYFKPAGLGGKQSSRARARRPSKSLAAKGYQSANSELFHGMPSKSHAEDQTSSFTLKEVYGMYIDKMKKEIHFTEKEAETSLNNHSEFLRQYYQSPKRLNRKYDETMVDFPYPANLFESNRYYIENGQRFEASSNSYNTHYPDLLGEHKNAEVTKKNQDKKFELQRAYSNKLSQHQQLNAVPSKIKYSVIVARDTSEQYSPGIPNRVAPHNKRNERIKYHSAKTNFSRRDEEIFGHDSERRKLDGRHRASQPEGGIFGVSGEKRRFSVKKTVLEDADGPVNNKNSRFSDIRKEERIKKFGRENRTESYCWDHTGKADLFPVEQNFHGIFTYNNPSRRNPRSAAKKSISTEIGHTFLGEKKEGKNYSYENKDAWNQNKLDTDDKCKNKELTSVEELSTGESLEVKTLDVNNNLQTECKENGCREVEVMKSPKLEEETMEEGIEDTETSANESEGLVPSSIAGTSSSDSETEVSKEEDEEESPRLIRMFSECNESEENTQERKEECSKIERTLSETVIRPPKSYLLAEASKIFEKIFGKRSKVEKQSCCEKICSTESMALMSREGIVEEAARKRSEPVGGSAEVFGAPVKGKNISDIEEKTELSSDKESPLLQYHTLLSLEDPSTSVHKISQGGVNSVVLQFEITERRKDEVGVAGAFGMANRSWALSKPQPFLIRASNSSLMMLGNTTGSYVSRNNALCLPEKSQQVLNKIESLKIRGREWIESFREQFESLVSELEDPREGATGRVSERRLRRILEQNRDICISIMATVVGTVIEHNEDALA